MSATFISASYTIRFDTWSEFKPYIDGTITLLAFFWSIEFNNKYKIRTELTGGHYLEVLIFIDGGADQLDFERNFKDLSPRAPGSNNIIVTTPKKKELYDIQSSVIFIGHASVNSLTSDPVWVIKKMTLDVDGNPVSTLWSSNVAIWDNRATESYT